MDHPKRAPVASIKETTLPDQVSRVRGKGSERGSVRYGVRGVRGVSRYGVRGVRGVSRVWGKGSENGQ